MEKEFTPELIFKVIAKLTGPVTPVGDSWKDSGRLENMETFIQVFDMMHTVIDDIAYRFKDSPRHSEKLIGELCARHIEKMGIVE